MEKNLEVEYIGNLNKDQFFELKDKFEKEGKFKIKKERISFMYFKDEIPKDMSNYADDGIDLRMRITNKNPEIILKKGEFTGSHSRKEISLPLVMDELQNYIDFLLILNWNKGVIYAVETVSYEYKGIEFSLIDIEDYGYNFEAEILTTKEHEQEAKLKINLILNELKLKAFNKEELDKQCNILNNRKELRFNFSKQTIHEFKEKFPKYF
jgi:hypothetical protein